MCFIAVVRGWSVPTTLYLEPELLDFFLFILLCVHWIAWMCKCILLFVLEISQLFSDQELQEVEIPKGKTQRPHLKCMWKWPILGQVAPFQILRCRGNSRRTTVTRKFYRLWPSFVSPSMWTASQLAKLARTSHLCSLTLTANRDLDSAAYLQEPRAASVS